MKKQTIKKKIEVEIKTLNKTECDDDECQFFDQEFIYCTLFEYQFKYEPHHVSNSKRCKKCIDEFGGIE